GSLRRPTPLVLGDGPKGSFHSKIQFMPHVFLPNGSAWKVGFRLQKKPSPQAEPVLSSLFLDFLAQLQKPYPERMPRLSGDAVGEVGQRGYASTHLPGQSGAPVVFEEV